MVWLRLALQNCGRRKLRTGVALAGIAVAVCALFSLFAFQRGYQSGLQGELERLGAHVLVVPKGCPYDAASIALHGASWPCYLKDRYVEQVRRTPGVDSASPQFMNAVYDSATGAQAVYVGSAPNIMDVKRQWKIEGAFPKAQGQCLVGSEIARTLKLKVGQEFALPGLNGEKGVVSGVLASTQGADDTFIYLSLEAAQKMFKRPKQLTHILVRLQDPNAMDQVVGALRGCEAGMDMNIVPLAHIFRTIQGLVASTRALLFCIALVALLVAGAGVSNTVLMAVAERVREIGVMRSMGAGQGDIFRIIWLETMALCLFGGVLGIVGALLGAGGLEQWLRNRLPFSPTETLIRPELSLMVFCLFVALALGSLSGLLPAWRASRLSPVEAIRAGTRV